MNTTPGDGDVTCWKCGHHYALQRKFCVQCGAKPTRPGSTPTTGSPAPSAPSSPPASPVVAPRTRAGTPFPTNIPAPAPVGPTPSSNSLAVPGPRPTPAVHNTNTAPASRGGPTPTPTPSAAPMRAPQPQQAAAPPAAATPSPGPRPAPPSAGGLHAPCAKCGSELSGTVATDASGRSYHPACFACAACGKQLTGDYHVVSSGGQDQFYCTEDFIAANSPACAVCAQPITGTGAEDHTGAKYHLNCFACKRCGTPISNKYIVDSKGDLCCGHCHSSSPPGAAGNSSSSSSSSSSAASDSSAFRCGICAGELSGQVVGVGDTRYHKHCFVCPGCKADLTHIPFHLENGQLRCKKCLLTEKGEFCAACGQLIEEGALQAMTKLWHEHCFKCGDCANVIGAGQSYAAKGQTPICASCATKY